MGGMSDLQIGCLFALVITTAAGVWLLEMTFLLWLIFGG